MNKWEYRRKQTEEKIHLLENADRIDPDIVNLKCMLLDIDPHSKAWRYGYMRSLKRAIKLIEEDNKQKK